LSVPLLTEVYTEDLTGDDDIKQELQALGKRVDLLARSNRELGERLLTVENSRMLRALRGIGVFFDASKRKAGQILLHSPLDSLFAKTAGDAANKEYLLWVDQQEETKPQTRTSVLLSVVMPVHNPRREWLEAAVNSVASQQYTNWELCASDDCSSEPWVAEYLAARAAADSRVRFVRSQEPLGIAGALNTAAALAQGDYLGFLDHDDVLSPQALEAVAEKVTERDRAATGCPLGRERVRRAPLDLIYTDEDRLDETGARVQPIFRPDWSPDLLTSCMYMGHFLVVSKRAWERAGGFRAACDGAQDFDLALRVSEFGGPEGAPVAHIPRVLYHWRMHGGSTSTAARAKPETHAAGRRALEDAMKRRGREARIEDGAIPNRYRVRPVVRGPEGGRPLGPPLASIVICSRNAALLAKCLKGIERNTAYANRELVVVRHQARDDSRMDALLAKVAGTKVSYAGKFNFARMNNLGAAAARGEVLVFLNDDVTPLTPEWLDWLTGHALRPEIGAAGAKLLYPSGAVQHAGIAVGIMDGAGHPFRGTFGSPYWHWLDCARNVSAVTAAAMAIRKGVFEQAGGFDPAFPVNYNDVDLCLRLGQAGYEIICEPAAVLRHHECRTRMPGTSAAERELFFERWYDLLEGGDPFYHPALVKDREDAGLRVE